MIRRTTWVILAIFVGLLGVVWYLQRSDGSEAAVDTTPAPVQELFDFDENNVAAVRVANIQGESVALQRDASAQWSLVEPQTGEIDLGRAESIVSQLVSLRTISTLDSTPDLAVVGLDPANYTITIDLNDGRQVVVRCGNLTPIETGYYVQMPGGPVHVTSKFGIEAVVGIIADPPILPTPTPETTPTSAEVAPAATAAP